MARTKSEFQTVRSEGGLLPPDLLRRVSDAKGTLPGSRLTDYGLLEADRLNEVITQSWTRLKRYWADFRAAVRNLPEGEPATALTNDKWNLPLLRELGFGVLPASAGPVIEEKTYPINRFFGATAIHLIGCGLSLDRRATGVRGATTNPHGLVQEFLNRSGNHLWGIVSNGLRFRILRDNQALSRQSYLEFDLDAMFAGDVFPDFVLLWLTAHATRFVPQAENKPETCWLEQWTKVAAEDGTRALGDLKAGVEKSLQILGEAFVSHPRNTALREALRSGELPLANLHGQLLRIVYRLIFLFVAEDRTLEGESLLHPRETTSEAATARERYATHYSTNRLRQLASKIKGSRHGDLWNQFGLLIGALYGEDRFDAVRQNLALPSLGSFLWNPESTANLNAASLAIANPVELTNADFLEALRHLAFTRQGKVLRPVDYKNLGAEELGGVYESLLALTPQISGDGNRFTFAEFAGNERKTSGSYYTPDSLVQCLLDSALDPVVDEALNGKAGTEAEQAILNLKVCDPAVGSGHFLVGAAHRLARHLARVRANSHGESEPSPLLYQHALRDVIGHCLYGVDINPMSAELCRVGLWLESLEPGKPLSFLDHHIQVGNSLLGTTTALLMKGIPDDAFSPIEGDVKARVSDLKKRNKRERQDYEQGQGYLFAPYFKLGNMAASFAELNATADDTVEAVSAIQNRYATLVRGTEYQHGRLLADTWCAAFVWKKDDSELGKLCPTERDFRKVESHAASGLLPHVRAEVERLRDQYQFFHWHLAFPDVFRLPGNDETPKNEQTGWSGGFDVLLGNPPWEKINLKDEEFFAESHPAIANAATKAARKQLLEQLRSDDPTGFAKYERAKDQHDHFSGFLRLSGYFPRTGVSRINLYSVFCETGLRLLAARGRLGMVLASGIVTDDNNKDLFAYLIDGGRLIHAWDFENSQGIFPGVHRSFKFLLLCASGPDTSQQQADFAFFLTDVQQLSEVERHFTLTGQELASLNPNTRTCPSFRNKREAEITKLIYRRVPTWELHEKDQFWPGTPKTPFNMSNDSALFIESATLRELGDGSSELSPLYESKFIFQFNHRFATFSENAEDGTTELSLAQLKDPSCSVASRYWLQRKTLNERFPGHWFFGYRMITNATNERAAVAAIIPERPCAHSLSIVEKLNANGALVLLGCVNSFVYDYAARQKIAGMNFSHWIWRQLPIIATEQVDAACAWVSKSKTVRDWLMPRVLELTYTAWDLEPFARDCGYAGPPFRWDEERRFRLRAELDAAFFHLYLPADENGDWRPARRSDGCPHDESPEDLAHLKASFPKPRDAVSYIMDTFPIVRRKDEEKYNGDYRTKRVILEIYDAMQTAIRTGTPYQTRLDPPPGPPVDSLPDWNPGEPRPSNWPSHIHGPQGGK